MSIGKVGAKDAAERATDVEIGKDGESSAGAPASGMLEASAFNPLGKTGRKHWQASVVSEGGLDQRGNVFFAAVEMTRMPMVVTDPNQPDNPVVFVNRAFQDMSGYEESEAIGRNCRFLQGPDTDPRAVSEIREAVEAGRAIAIDVLNYKRDGTPFWNALFIGPIFDPDGKLIYFFSSQLDITRRRFSEQSFRQAQKMEAIGQLTAGLAHDFNNLLQVVMGNLELAKTRAGEDTAMMAVLERAARSAQKGAKLTQQLLSFARKQRLESKRVNLNSLVVEFSEMIARSLSGSVKLNLDLRPDLPQCELDPTHFEMALLNVLINARDAMPHGGEVTVATSIYENPAKIEAHGLERGTYVVICVIDHGEGMSEEVRRRAMEPFFTTKGSSGTGLGLAMVHGFVQQSQGRVEIESQPGRGTTVRMIFPAAKAAAERPDGEPLPEKPPAPARGRLLIVDDSDDVREIAEAFASSAGYATVCVGSGEEALGLLEGQGAVDLVLSDIVMPGGMSGMQLAERAKALRPGLPVLLMTGYSDESARMGGNGADVLAKPFRRAELLSRIGKAIERARQEQPADA